MSRGSIVRVAAVGIAVVLAGCSDDPSEEPSATATDATSVTSTATTPAAVEPSGSAPASSPSAPSTATTATASSSTATTEAVITTTIAPAPITDAAGQPLPPANPVELARRLVAVESRVRADEPIEVAELTALGHEHQVLHRALGRHDEWQTDLSGLLDPAVLARANAIVAAGRAASTTIGSPLESIPAWRIRAPLPPDELTTHYVAAESATGAPWEVLAAINLVETRMGRIVGLSSAGAQGPMQFIPTTWDLYGAGGDPYSDADAIAAAGRLLADGGAPADMARAVYAYNPSDAYVASILAYADVIAADPWIYQALWGWQVYVTTVAGAQWLPEGFETPEPLPVAAAADHLPPPVPTIAP